MSVIVSLRHRPSPARSAAARQQGRLPFAGPAIEARAPAVPSDGGERDPGAPRAPGGRARVPAPAAAPLRRPEGAVLRTPAVEARPARRIVLAELDRLRPDSARRDPERASELRFERVGGTPVRSLVVEALGTAFVFVAFFAAAVAL